MLFLMKFCGPVRNKEFRKTFQLFPKSKKAAWEYRRDHHSSGERSQIKILKFLFSSHYTFMSVNPGNFLVHLSQFAENRIRVECGPCVYLYSFPKSQPPWAPCFFVKGLEIDKILPNFYTSKQIGTLEDPGGIEGSSKKPSSHTCRFQIKHVQKNSGKCLILRFFVMFILGVFIVLPPTYSMFLLPWPVRG